MSIESVTSTAYSHTGCITGSTPTVPQDNSTRVSSKSSRINGHTYTATRTRAQTAPYYPLRPAPAYAGYHSSSRINPPQALYASEQMGVPSSKPHASPTQSQNLEFAGYSPALETGSQYFAPPVYPVYPQTSAPNAQQTFLLTTEISHLTSLLTKSETELAKTKSQLTKKIEQSVEQEQQLTEQDSRLSKQDSRLTEQEEQLTQQKSLLIQRETQIKSKDSCIVQQLINSNSQESRLNLRDSQLTEKNKLIAEKDKLVAEKDKRITEKDQLIAENKTYLNLQSSLFAVSLTADQRSEVTSREFRLVEKSILQCVEISKQKELLQQYITAKKGEFLTVREKHLQDQLKQCQDLLKEKNKLLSESVCSSLKI
ncbi:MAG: hypothetical protein HAW66_02840 [Shewanella sp.]|nr:hypothetical protein [Shewanella sp.]